MQSPTVPTMATGTLAMTPSTMMAKPIIAGGGCARVPAAGRRRDTKALHVQRALGTRAAGLNCTENDLKFNPRRSRPGGSDGDDETGRRARRRRFSGG
eukprot:10359453-Alexandrium_andersonii.AAC.1